MLVAGFPSDVFGTNCYVVATGPGEQCVVIDPGIGVVDQMDEVIAENRLHPVAVLLTHGHLDHTFSVAPVCGARGITAYVHPDDREMLADPAKALSTDISSLFGGRLPYTEPDDVAELADGTPLKLAGLEFVVDHAPGHTGGSVLFRLPGGLSPGSAGNVHLDIPAGLAGTSRPESEEKPLCFSGDVLFAGSIGRTDLPGGSNRRMVESLRDKILPLDDATVVLPGHGPATTIGRERAANPYLQDLDAGERLGVSRRECGQPAPHRGL